MLAIIQCRNFVVQFAIQNHQINKYRTKILSPVLYGSEIWSPILREKYGLRIFERRVLRKTFGQSLRAQKYTYMERLSDWPL